MLLAPFLWGYRCRNAYGHVWPLDNVCLQSGPHIVNVWERCAVQTNVLLLQILGGFLSARIDLLQPASTLCDVDLVCVCTELSSTQVVLVLCVSP